MTERRSVPRRAYLTAATLGLAAAIGTVGLVAGLVVWARDEPVYDGTFRLEEPGIYEQTTTDVNEQQTGERVPDAALVDTAGRSVTLGDYAGRPLVVNLWFSSCPPCRRELADFAEVHAEVGNSVEFVGVDPFDTTTAMVEFAGARGVTYDLLRDPERTFVNELGVVAYPVTLFVAPDGTILRQTGAIDADELRGAIDELFG